MADVKKNWKECLPWLSLLLVASSVSLAAAVLLILRLGPEQVEVLDFDVGAVISLLLSLFTVTLFIERAVEVIVSAWREPSRKAVENEIAVRRRNPGEGTTAAGQAGPEERLVAYKAATARIAAAMTLMLGIIAAVVGFRVLQPLVDTDSLDLVAGWQRGMFKWVDILVTGGLIGGGSEGIHQIMKTIIGAFEATKAWLEKKKRQQDNDSG